MVVDGRLAWGIRGFFRELDRRIRVLYAFIGLHLTHQQLVQQYNQLYATALGASPVELGSLTSLRSVVSALIATPSGWLADRYGPKRVLLVGLACVAAIAAMYWGAGSWVVLMPAFLLMGVGQGLIMPFVDMALITYGRPENKSMVISISRTLWAIPRTVAPLAAAVIVTQFGGITAEGIRPLYALQLGLAVVVVLAIAVWLKPAPGAAPDPPQALVRQGRGFLQDFRDVFAGERYLTRYLVLSAVRSIGMNTAMAFIPLWMVQEKQADPYILGAATIGGMVVAILLQIPVGRLSDRIGRKKAFFLLRPFSWLAELLLIVAPSPAFLILVGILGGNVSGGGEGGGIGGVSFIPHITMEWEMVPEAKRGRWHGILGLCRVLAFPAAIVGGILWQQGFMVEILLLPIVLEVAIVMPILLTIPETLGRTSSR
jgi:MFS family permease